MSIPNTLGSMDSELKSDTEQSNQKVKKFLLLIIFTYTSQKPWGKYISAKFYV